MKSPPHICLEGRYERSGYSAATGSIKVQQYNYLLSLSQCHHSAGYSKHYGFNNALRTFSSDRYNYFLVF